MDIIVGRGECGASGPLKAYGAQVEWQHNYFGDQELGLSVS